MKSIIIVVLGLSLFACSEDSVKTNLSNVQAARAITGTWKLTETLADPGDGSGVFQEVESNKSISFFTDGTFTSTEQLCYTALSQGDSGTYDIKTGIINSTVCQNNNTSYKITFEISENVLILNYPCIEPCAEKYVKTPIN